MPGGGSIAGKAVSPAPAPLLSPPGTSMRIAGGAWPWAAAAASRATLLLLRSSGVACAWCGGSGIDETSRRLEKVGSRVSCTWDTLAAVPPLTGGAVRVCPRWQLAEKTGRTSVPALYVGGAFVGGCNDGGLGGVLTLDKAGKLKPMLTDAGAL